MIFSDTSFQPNFSQNEAVIRIGCFLLLFTVIAIAEIAAPRRMLTVKKSLRWFGNGSVHLVNGLNGFMDIRHTRFWKMILNPLEKG